MENLKKGVLLINLGTPDSPQVADVRKYLRQFLMDGRVIDIHPVMRFLLVNLIIAPFRSPRSAHEYRKVWTEKGSPLLWHGVALKEKLQQELPSDYVVTLGMRYQNPSIASALDILRKENVSEIIVFPLFPQYASATTGSAHEEVMNCLKDWLVIPSVRFIDAYPADEGMINTFAEIGEEYRKKEEYEHFVFTYHGLPERHLKKENSKCLTSNCCDNLHTFNRLCYRAQCYETSRRLAQKLNIEAEKYSVCFQSRLGKDPWIQPYTEDEVKKLAKKGKKKVLVFTPSFVADCLETIVEVGETYKESFIENGGHTWQLASSLNSHTTWIKAVASMILKA